MKKWKCTVCGYIHDGDQPPEECPLCKASADKFEEVREEGETRYWKCTICGYIHEGDSPPEECPLCKAGSDKFIEVDADGADLPAAPRTVKKVAQSVVEPEVKKPNIIVRLNSIFHLHPISVHTPNGILPLALLMLFGGMFLRITSFEVAAYYNMVFTLAVMPVVLMTGYLEWQNRYRGAKSFLFIVKIFCAAVATLLLGVLVLWRFIEPGVAGPESPFRLIYLAMAAGMVVAVGIAGHLGGKLVFGGRELLSRTVVTSPKD